MFGQNMKFIGTLIIRRGYLIIKDKENKLQTNDFPFLENNVYSQICNTT